MGGYFSVGVYINSQPPISVWELCVLVHLGTLKKFLEKFKEISKLLHIILPQF